jgi:Flp pilus assembly protein TadD
MTIVKERSLQQLIDAAKWPEIQRHTKRILAKAPKDLDALRARAMACHALGEFAEAKKLLERTRLYHPQDARTHCDLGVMLAEEGHYTEARRAFIQAIRIDDRYAKAYYNLAVALKRQEDCDAAENILRSCIKLGLADTRAEALFGEVLLHQGKMQEAQKHLALLLSSNDQDWRVWSNIGYACGKLGDDASAAVFLSKAYAIKPDDVDVLLNYGSYLNRIGRANFAKTILDMAESLAEQDGSSRTAAARWNRSFAHFNLGNWDAAWRDYQAGFEARERKPYRRFNVPEWTGDPLEGRRLLVWGEQGLGDKVGDVFHLTRLLAHHTNVIIETEVRLVDLFARTFPEANVRATGTKPGVVTGVAGYDFDLHIPAMNLRKLFAEPTHMKTEAQRRLATKPDLSGRWREFFDSSYPNVLRVGLAWRSGTVSPFGNSTQNLRLKDWAAVLKVPGVQFFSLAYYDDELEVCEAEREHGIKIHRFTDVDMRDDLENVVAISANLDITIGAAITPAMIAHAAGCETWYIVPSSIDRHWLRLGRNDGRTRSFVHRVRDEQPPQATLEKVGAELAAQTNPQRERAVLESPPSDV